MVARHHWPYTSPCIQLVIHHWAWLHHRSQIHHTYRPLKIRNELLLLRLSAKTLRYSSVFQKEKDEVWAEHLPCWCIKNSHSIYSCSQISSDNPWLQAIAGKISDIPCSRFHLEKKWSSQQGDSLAEEVHNPQCKQYEDTQVYADIAVISNLWMINWIRPV